VTCQPNVKFMQWYVGMPTSTYVGLVTKKLQNECNYFNWPTSDERRVILAWYTVGGDIIEFMDYVHEYTFLNPTTT
jgi:hypothetical protein